METYRSDVIGCFILGIKGDVVETYRWDVWIRTTETSWWRTTETSLGVSFETCLRRRGEALIRRHYYVLLRRCHDVPITRRGDVALRHLDDVPSRRSWVFHLGRTCDVAGAVRETSLRCHHDVLLARGVS